MKGSLPINPVGLDDIAEKCKPTSRGFYVFSDPKARVYRRFAPRLAFSFGANIYLAIRWLSHYVHPLP